MADKVPEKVPDSCATCKFFQYRGKADDQGNCRAHPPMTMAAPMLFAFCTPGGWCGEFSPAKKPATPYVYADLTNRTAQQPAADPVF